MGTNTTKASHRAIDDAIALYDWPACAALLSGVSHARRIRELAYILRRLLHSGAIVVSRGRRSALKRDIFVNEFLAYARRASAAKVVKRIPQAIDTARVFDSLYEDILRLLRRSGASTLSPSEHIWGLLVRFCKEYALICSDIERGGSGRTEVVDVYGATVTNEQGHAYRPDAVLGPMGDVLSSALIMLAYENGWFDRKTGRLTLPPKPSITDDAINRSGITMLLGASWSTVQMSEERWRFFDASVRAFEGYESSLLGRKCRAVTVSPENAVDLLDHVADERLNQILLRVQMDMKVEVRAIDAPGPSPSLPPVAFIDAAERDFFLALDTALHIEVVSDKTRYGGMLLVEWIRGYSALRNFANRVCAKDGDDAIYIGPRLTLEIELISPGLPRAVASIFLDAVTLAKGKEDLFDAPLLEVSGGDVCLLLGLVAVTNPLRALLSNLAALDIRISRKGKGLERRLIEVFAINHIEAKELHFWRDGNECQCDGAAIWDGVLFLFECKNRSLSAGRPSRYHTFLTAIGGGASQLQRVSRAIERHPEVVRQALGPSAQWRETVCCVVSGLPWSAGEIDGVCFYDMSALMRFFEAGTVYLKIIQPLATDANVMWRHHIVRLWTGDRPSAADFINQLRRPWQLKAIASNYRLVEQENVCEEDRVFCSTMFRRQEHTLKEMLEALGAEEALDDIEGIQEKLRTFKLPKAESNNSE
jgi:hypothetical protein